MLRAAMMTLVFAVSACGVGEAEISSGDLQASADDALRAMGAKISATDSKYGGTTVVSFYPGGYADSSVLMAMISCSQKGELVLATGSLNYKAFTCDFLAAQGILCKGDHYEVTLGPLMSQSYTGGPADCVANGIAYSKGGREKTVASSPFHLEP